jgi:hypothetical protein
MSKFTIYSTENIFGSGHTAHNINTRNLMLFGTCLSPTGEMVNLAPPSIHFEALRSTLKLTVVPSGTLLQLSVWSRFFPHSLGRNLRIKITIIKFKRLYINIFILFFCATKPIYYTFGPTVTYLYTFVCVYG